MEPQKPIISAVEQLQKGRRSRIYIGSISPLQIYPAIRNRGYTNEVRLGGLQEFETHGGGFCLYSREFHSPGQAYFYKSEMLPFTSTYREKYKAISCVERRSSSCS